MGAEPIVVDEAQRSPAKLDQGDGTIITATIADAGAGAAHRRR